MNRSTPQNNQQFWGEQFGINGETPLCQVEASLGAVPFVAVLSVHAACLRPRHEVTSSWSVNGLLQKVDGAYNIIWIWVKMEDLGDHRC